MQAEVTFIGRLRELDGQPDAQVAAAVELLAAGGGTFDVQAALRVLAEYPDPTHRERLLALYHTYDEDGVRRDVGGTLRSETLKALRPVAVAEDVALFEHAAMTEEWLPPGPSEVGAPLRSAGLVALVAVDDAAATLHAVRLLRHEHTDRLGGEPALTAARVLAAQGQTGPLYDYVLTARERVPEVVQVCLGALDALPLTLMRDLAARFECDADAAELVGMFDLLIARDDRDELAEHVTRFLEGLEDDDVYRYLVTLIMADRRGSLGDAVLHQARWEMRPARAAILEEALALRAGDPEVDEVIAKLAGRRRRTTDHG